MKDLFTEILEIEHVIGAMLLSHEGKTLFEQFPEQTSAKVQETDWQPFIVALDKSREMELVFDDAVLYVRKCEAGYLMILMGRFASVSMVRLNCDSLIPTLEKQASKGLFRFFKRK